MRRRLISELEFNASMLHGIILYVERLCVWSCVSVQVGSIENARGWIDHLSRVLDRSSLTLFAKLNGIYNTALRIHLGSVNLE